MLSDAHCWKPIWSTRGYRGLAVLIITMTSAGCGNGGFPSLAALFNPELEPDAPERAIRIEPAGTEHEAVIDAAGDVSYFVFTAREGQIYDVALRGDADTVMGLYRSDTATALTYSDRGGVGGDEHIWWLSGADEDLYLGVALYDRLLTGTCLVSVTPVQDDHGDDAGAATLLTPDIIPAEGRIHHGWDNDYFAFSAEAGQMYNVQLFSTDDTHFQLLDTDGVSFLDDGWSSYNKPNPIITWVAPISGRYHVRVQGYPGSEYRVSLQTIHDDHAGSAAGATILAVNATPLDGRFETPQDYDFFQVTLEAGIEYVIQTFGTSDPVMVLYDADGIGVVGDDDSGEAANPRIDWTPSSAGIFHVSVRPFSADQVGGTYQVIVSTRQ